MKNTIKSLFLVALVLLSAVGSVRAERWVGETKKRTQQAKAGSAKCLSATNSNELTINNVRAYIETNGTMWNKELAEYEVPKGSGKSSMFAAALWIGGMDDNNQLKLAAVRFRQVGDDYWTGPLSVDGLAQIAQEDCAAWDKMFKMTRAEVDEHINTYNTHNHSVPNPSLAIRNWPAHGDYDNKLQSFYLAPFKDVNGNYEYDPENGDYPYYDIDNDLCPWTEANKARAAHGLLPIPYEQSRVAEFPTYANSIGIDGMVYADHVLKGDETLFWIFNDKGNAHTETGGASIGLEIRAQAFAFQTNDDLNNMTFYSYEIINRSTTNLNQTFFSQWVDPDLGYSHDDYVGCDVARGLGYCYNGSATDGSGLAQHYGSNPPAVGVDFFQGPYIDADYMVDDSTGERIGRDNPKFDLNQAGVVGTVANKLYCDQFLKSAYTNDQFAINGVNFGDSIANNERFGMRRFVFHNNDNTSRGDPSKATEYYQMLKGIWKDGQRMVYGAMAHPQYGGVLGPECDFMFPGTSDPCNWGIEDPAQRDVFNYQNYGGPRGWVEETVAGNQPGDRRFMQSAGPFTLRRGAVNYITVGIPWARSYSGGAWQSVELLKIADDKCQALFENCFKVLDGPDAPDVTIKEYENELIIYLTNDRDDSNNKDESYAEVDPQINEGYTTDSTYTQVYIDPVDGHLDSVTATTSVYKTYPEGSNKYYFEGYQIYQVSGKDVSVSDIGNMDKVRLIAQCDIVNYRADGTAIGQLINWEFDQNLNTNVAVEKVNGANSGIQRTFRVTEDKFATGTNNTLVNHKTYYFMVIAYAYNEYAPFSIDEQVTDGLKGQKTPYLAGRRNIKVYSAIPHSPKATGVDVNKLCAYGTQPQITRLEGQGNGGFVLELDDASKERILKGGNNGDFSAGSVTYKNNFGPIDVRVIDPLQVKPLDYEVRFVQNGEEVNNDTRWVLSVTGVDGVNFSSKEELYAYLKDTFNITKPVDTSNFSINVATEQLFMELGLSVAINNKPFEIHDDSQLRWLEQANDGVLSSGAMLMGGQVTFLQSSLSFQNSSSPWLFGQVDIEGEYPSNWIRSGKQASGNWEQWSSQDGAEDEYMKWRNEDACEIYPPNGDESPYTTQCMRAFRDPISQYEAIVYGTWAPYVISSPYSGGVKAGFIVPDTVFYAAGTGCPTPRYYDFAELLKQKEYTRGDLWPHYDDGRSATQHASVNHAQWSLGHNMTMTNLYSVDVVFTSDKNLWTRCLVLESGSTATGYVPTEYGDNVRHEPKKAPSVDKNGNPDNSGTTGFGWFPGYAINVETGERLNVMFAENSLDTLSNGNDMIFNPTNIYASYVDSETGEMVILTESEYRTMWDNYAILDQGGVDDQHAICKMPEPSFGGRHYLYICNSAGSTAPIQYEDRFAKRNYNDDDQMRAGAGTVNAAGTHTSYQHGGLIRNLSDNDNPVVSPTGATYNYYECGPYDEGEWLAAKFSSFTSDTSLNRPQRKAVKMQLFNNVMWTTIPMPTKEYEDQWLQPGNDATVKIRVSRPYMRYRSRWYSDDQRMAYEAAHGPIENGGFPLYAFSTADLAPVINTTTEYHDEMLADINIVPNPYYGFSKYESTALETYVKIVNLPAPCDVSIYSSNGVLIRTLSKKASENATTYIDWDLKNHAGIPVAGGVYIIHVKAPGVGERTLRFFCAMRPTDLNAF
jgi:hypothetical protein